MMVYKSKITKFISVSKYLSDVRLNAFILISQLHSLAMQEYNKQIQQSIIYESRGKNKQKTPKHPFTYSSNSNSVATHIQINKTNRASLETKSVPPKNSMNLFITEALSIGIMILQQG